MRVGTSLRSGYRAHGRTGGCAVDGRAGAGRGRRRARQPVRRRPPQRARSLLPERRRSSAACSRSGTTGPRARCSSCRSGIRCCSRNRSGRSRRSRRAVHHAVRGRWRRRTVPRVRHDRCASGRSASRPALDIVRALCRGESVTVDGRTVEDRPTPRSRPCRPNRSRSGSARPSPPRRRPGRAPRRRVPDRPRGDSDRSASRSCRPIATRARATAANRRRIAVRRDVHVAATDAEADAVAAPIVDRGLPRLRPVGRRHRWARPGHGSVRRISETLGCTDVIVRHLANDQEPVLRSFEQLATVRENLR